MKELKVASCFEFEKVLRGRSNKLFYSKSEVDAAIAEQKQKLEDAGVRERRLNNALDKERSETIKYMDELCNAKNEIERLTIDKRNNELRADVADATVEKLKTENAELKAQLESEKASRDAESVDAGMENRRLKRALWLAREQTAIEKHNHFALCHNHSTDLYLCINGASIPTEKSTTMRLSSEWSMIWKRVVAKCRAKAEEYK